MNRERQIGFRSSVPRLAFCAVMVTSLFSAGSAAEFPHPSSTVEPNVAELETLVVEAQRQRLERQISAFVSAITFSSRFESLARWERPICPLVAGFDVEQGKYVFERISQVASDAEVRLAPRSCHPNLFVVMAPEPEIFLEKWWRKDSRLFDTYRGVGAIERTIRTDAPVRVFYNVCSTAPPAKPFTLSVELDCYNKGVAGSKLEWGAVRAIYSVIVVVDPQQTKDVKIGPLSDHIAMLALAQIRSDRDLGTAPTILRLFDETSGSRLQKLSRWDQSFLKSLYGTDSSSVMQSSEIEVRMTRDLTR